MQLSSIAFFVYTFFEYWLYNPRNTFRQFNGNYFHLFTSYLFCWIRYQPAYISPPPTAKIHPQIGRIKVAIIPIPIEPTIIPNFFLPRLLFHKSSPSLNWFYYIICAILKRVFVNLCSELSKEFQKKILYKLHFL